MPTKGKMTADYGEAFEAMHDALAEMQRRNVVGIYDSSGCSLFPKFVAVSLADFNAGRAALALADKVKRGH